MRVSKNKLEVALARQCKNLHELRGELSPQTLTKINRGDELQAKTVGRLAQLLQCDPADLIEEA
ncbi:MAG: hypothetical protein E7425_10580 [Ruminococcaceae bacterium]|nr:hypothetical protein [Oscillospiraceae bacterium]